MNDFMDKLVYTGDQDNLMSALSGVIARVFTEGHYKEASSDAFSAELIRSHRPDSRHVGVHLIALGAGEDWGFNKNGDHFTRAGLMNKSGSFGMHTFVKSGHYYHEHNNWDPRQAKGDIKAAAFNPKMQRGELIVHIDRDKAPEDCADAEAGKTMTYSMSCRVPGDRCSCCNNFAKSSRVYCSHLKKYMTRWHPDFQKFAFAINDEPNFFDLSRVADNADRTAYFLQYLLPDQGEMAKAASAGEFPFSDVAATKAGLIVPAEYAHFSLARQQLLKELAADEELHRKVANVSVADMNHDLFGYLRRTKFATQVAPFAFDAQAVTDQELESLRRCDPQVLFAKLASHRAVLPFLTFYAYVYHLPVKEAAASTAYQEAEALLPEAFKLALEADVAPAHVAIFEPADTAKLAGYNPVDPIDKLISPVVAKTTTDLQVVYARSLRNVEQFGGVTKAAATRPATISPEAQAIVIAYAHYKAAAVEAMALGDSSVDDTVKLLVTYPTKS